MGAWQDEPTEEAPNRSRVVLEPLTRLNEDGQLYQRSPEVEAQIYEALAIEVDELARRAGLMDHKSSDYLKDEVLVYLIRQGHGRCPCTGDDPVARALFDRWKGRIAHRLRGLGDAQGEAEDEVVARLVDEILGPEGKGDFLQVRFEFRIRKLLIDTYNKYDRRRKKGRWHVPLDHMAGEESGDAEADADSYRPALKVLAGWDEAPTPDVLAEREQHRHLIQAAIDLLPDELGELVTLRFFEGWQIESNEPNEITLSSHYGVTPKTVYNRLERAKEILRQWIERD